MMLVGFGRRVGVLGRVGWRNPISMSRSSRTSGRAGCPGRSLLPCPSFLAMHGVPGGGTPFPAAARWMRRAQTTRWLSTGRPVLTPA